MTTTTAPTRDDVTARAEGQTLRIWHVNLAREELKVDGIHDAVTRLAQAQADQGHQVTIHSTGPAGPLASARAIVAQARTDRPDVVHLHSVFRPAHAYLAANLSLAGIPYVTSPHSGLAADALKRDRWRKAVYIRLIERRLLHGARTVMCLTPTEVAEVRRAAPHARTTVVPNAIDITTKAPRWRARKGRPQLVCLSRYDVYQKGLDRLSAIASCMPEVDVVVHGAQDANQPEATEALRLIAPTNFTLAAPVFGHAKAQVLARASLYVQTSRWEGLSMSVIEAMAAGVPVAVSEYIAASMSLPGGAALVLDDDPATAAEQIRTALDNPPSLVRMGKAGQEFVRTQYDPSSVAQISVWAYGA